PTKIGFYCADFEGSIMNCTLEDWDRIAIQTYSPVICEAIVKIAQGANATVQDQGVDNYLVPGDQKFGCFDNGDADYIFVYRVY
ncbi:MAG TPA: hypothetical protein PKW15_00840, partial [Alphaproteobacteria bacterium]|nr:hypothetical protein [Alphaproteobacteria bacterium]